MTHIPDAAVQAAKLFRYCCDTGKLYWRVSRGKAKAGDEVGCINSDGYLQTKMSGKSVLVHRVVWLIHNGKWPECYIDHNDGNKINNKIKNLSNVTQLGNMQNLKRPKHNTSGFIGVSFDKVARKWKAAIKYNRKSKSLGLYDNPEDAHKAYLAAKEKYHTVNPVPREGYND